MGPADATLTESLTLLRTNWASEVEGVLNGRYAFWLGSGISRERYPDLPNLLAMLLCKLQAGIDHSKPACPYRQALRDVLELTSLRDVDISRPPAEWPDLPDIIKQLQPKYSEALDVELRVNGTARELFWDLLELQQVYGDPSVPPDAEHKFLAVLIEEAIIAELVTTNWDPLIELASEACRPGAVARVAVVVRNEDIRGSRDAGAPRLSKIHGCAHRSLYDPDTYRPFLVATQTQISQWSNGQAREPFRELVQTILREKLAFFIGLSGQDHNLQATCIKASLATNYFAEASRVLFAASGIKSAQHAILKAIYEPKYYSDHADDIHAKAALPLYAKPLLGSLYVLALRKKVSILLEGAPDDFQPAHHDLIQRAIARIEQLLCQRYDGIADPTTRWRQLANEVPSLLSRFLSIYRRQDTPSAPDAYECITSQNPMQMAVDPLLVGHDLVWLLLAIGLILEGERRSMWAAALPGASGGEYGQLTVVVTGSRLRVFFIMGGTGMAKLYKRSFVDANDAQHVVVVYPTEREPPFPRRGSPGRRMPGAAVKGPLEVWLKDIVEDGQTTDDLVKEFQRKLAS